MKRSEMIGILMDVIDSDDSYPLALRILNRIEEVGMKPPCNSGYDGHKLENYVDGHCDDYIESCSFEWEKEDDV